MPVRRSDGPFSTNNPDLMGPIYEANVILTGPGSPTYAGATLPRQPVLGDLPNLPSSGGAPCFCPAPPPWRQGILPCRCTRYTRWDWICIGRKGLDLFDPFGLKLVVIPHWNNQSGGSGLDTSRCYMGQSRFNELLELLPAADGLTVLGIDENTAVIMNPGSGRAQVLGQGSATIVRNDETREIVHDP